MGMFGMLSAAILAGGLLRHYFGSQGEDAGDHERASNKSKSKLNEGSANSQEDTDHTHDQDLNHDSNPKSVKSSSNHFHRSDYEKNIVDHENIFAPSNETHHQDQEKSDFPTSVPRYFEYYPNLFEDFPTSVPRYFEYYPNLFEGQQTLKKESHNSKTREYPNSTSSIKSTISTITSKPSSTSSSQLYQTGEPTFSEIIESKIEQQKEEPPKQPSDFQGLSPPSSSKSSTTSQPSSASSSKLSPTGKPAISEIVVEREREREQQKEKPPKWPSDPAGLCLPSSPKSTTTSKSSSSSSSKLSSTGKPSISEIVVESKKEQQKDKPPKQPSDLAGLSFPSSPNSTTTSKSSFTNSSMLSPAGKPTIFENVESKNEQQKEKPLKRPSDPAGLSIPSSPKSTTTSKSSSTSSSKLSSTGKPSISEIVVESKKEQQKDKPPKQPSDLAGLRFPSSPNSTTTSKSSFSNSSMLSPAGKPTISENVESQKEQQKEKPLKRPSDPAGLSIPSSPKSTTTSKSSSTNSLKLSPIGKSTISENVESKREQQKEKPPKQPSDCYGLSPPSSPESNKSPPSFKPTLWKVSMSDDEMKNGEDSIENYFWLENDSLPLYLIPEDIRDLIENDIVPEVLKGPLTRSAYKDYFAALLYAEEFYLEKWSDFELEDVPLEFHEAAIYRKLDENSEAIYEEKDDKVFMEFNIDLRPYERPFLLSRDLVFARPSGSQVERFQGYLKRVVRRNVVLVEFEDDFYYQHYPSRKYDISFSFNRVCLKRSHQAINDLSDSSFKNFVFPNSVLTSKKSNHYKPSAIISNNHHHLDPEMSSAVRWILSIQSNSPPYLLSGPRCVSEAKSCSYETEPSRTGVVIQEAVIQIYKASANSRILICAPYNSACDVLIRGLIKVIPESDMFRANAAFREKEEVPDDILPFCLYTKESECFSFPSYEELTGFRVIFSTFISSFRLQNEGLPKGHFSHVFMVDASFAIEPDSMVPLANFVDNETIVVVSGDPGETPRFVRSDIARRYGLKTSYFERLYCNYYSKSLNPSFITELIDSNVFCNNNSRPIFPSGWE